MEHVFATITFRRKCKSLGRIHMELVSQVNQCEKIENRFCLQRLVSVIKFMAEGRLAFRGDNENVELPRTFFSKKFSKKRCDSGDLFCNSFTNR